MKSNIHSENFKIGLLGGGQLGRMTLQEAYNLNLHIDVLDPTENAPCSTLANRFVCGDFKDFDTVYNFGKDKNVMTIEFEDVNSDALEKLEQEGVKVFPQARVLKIIQDKGLQKEFYKANNIPTSPFVLVDKASEIKESQINFPIFQKLRKSGYDGYGVQGLENKSELAKAFDAPSVLEQKVELNKELSVIVARNESGETSHFPLVELEFNPKANMVEFLFSPASVSKEIEQKAYQMAEDVISKLEMVGLLAVEMFLDKDGNLMVNEVAPRAHNSGHQSIEGNFTSQFGQHLRAILNLPLGNTDIRIPSVMVNLLGEENANGVAEYVGMAEVLKWEGVYPHLYGKEMVKPFRKMGHITIVNQDLEKAKALANKVKQTVKVQAKQ
ncbi:MAG: 5-(carboxyamino)imidazole ribonucleotide synthase [Vicingaceae bacterium]